MFSKTIVIGRLTAKPELIFTPSNVAIANFTVACDKFKKEDGADFYNVKAFKKQAENCAEYLDKGSLVMIEGRFTHRDFQNKEGQNVRVWELIAENVKFLSPKNSDSAPSGRSNDPFADDGKPIDISDDQLPF